MNRILSRLIFSFTLLAALTACVDEVPYDDVVPEGMGRVSATVDFKDFMPALESRAAGDAIKSINSLWVVVYNTDGEFIKKEQITDFKVNTTRPNTRPDGANQAEESTGHAEFEFLLPNGRYHIYAVANFDLSGYDETKLATEADLQNIELEWDNDPANVTNNAEMFGYFAENNKNSADGFDAPVVTVKGGTSLHAWIRRAASKLTIVYDGSGLKDNVVVYIKSATIKDIPVKCYLGATNRPGGSTAAPGEPDSSDGPDPATLLYPEGETVKYYEGDTAPDDNDFSITHYEYAVSSGGGVRGNHNEDSDKSLFFYENVQPVGEEGTVTDKRQVVKDATETTTPTFPDGNKPDNGYDKGWKDGRKYGTYVEIKAFYRSDADGHRSSGEIIYRFMLGKNVTTSYSAERNHHYKLTMKFKGYANDVDFHIDYDIPSPSVHVQPYYISYLYNHSMMYPVTIHAGHGEVEKVEAEIIENHWYPEVTTGETQIFYDKDKALMKADDYQWHGFLSLRKTKQTVITTPAGKGVSDMVSEAVDSKDNGKYGGVNYTYYYDHLRHRREYSDMTDGSHFKDARQSDSKTKTVPAGYDKEEEKDFYTVKKSVDPESGENVYTLMVPMYTRAKQMIKANAYTGNNPFVAYQRKAVVRFKVWISGLAEPIVEDATITQVRRVVNPKGIYRESGSIKNFHAVLRILPTENSENFEDLVSEGPWKAYVIAGNRGVVTLSKGTGMATDTVRGKTGSTIDFMVNFQGVDGDAVIRVDYHNYTCNHLIFVKEGYGNEKLYSDDVQWHMCNLRTKNEEAENPAEEGSLFKYGNLDNPIDASSNVNVKIPWLLPATPSVITDNYDPATAQLNIATDGHTKNENNAGPKLWSSFNGVEPPFLNSDRTLGGKLSDARVANLTDYYNLYLHEDIEQGYGVLYADNATECATHISAVYGYRYDQESYEDEACGMQGMFAYNKNVDDVEYGGRNMFFPIGNSSYGFRRPSNKGQGSDVKKGPLYEKGGWLLYAARNDFYELPKSDDQISSWANDAVNIVHRPLFYDKWRRPGALYWLENKVSKSLKEDGTNTYEYMGWDINYFTFDYYGITYGDMCNGSMSSDSGAAFVRLVEGTATPLPED